MPKIKGQSALWTQGNIKIHFHCNIKGNIIKYIVHIFFNNSYIASRGRYWAIQVIVCGIRVTDWDKEKAARLDSKFNW